MALMTVNEIAETLKVHPRTVKRWITEKQISAIKLGDRAGWRVEEEALQAFLEERRQDGDMGKAAA